MDYHYGYDYSNKKKRSAKFSISKRTKAAILDFTLPFLFILIGCFIFIVLAFLYIGLGALTAGMIWFLLEEEFAALPGLLYKFVALLIIATFIAQIVLHLVKGISLGKSIYHLKIVDTVTESKPSFKQLLIRGLMNNWLTKCILPYSIYSYITYRRSGKALHDTITRTKVVEHQELLYK